MTQPKHPHTQRRAHRGAGLLFVLVFLLATMVVAASLDMVVGPAQLQSIQASQDHMIAEFAAQSALGPVRDAMLADLDGGGTIVLNEEYTGNITAPIDPNNMGGATETVASYVGKIIRARAPFYVVKITATSVGGRGVASYTHTVAMRRYTVDCAAIEATIFAGNISTISNADLIQYARQGCMLRPASTPPSVPALDAGTGTSCSSGAFPGSPFTGSGTLNIGSITGTCGTLTVGSSATYTKMRFATINRTGTPDTTPPIVGAPADVNYAAEILDNANIANLELHIGTLGPTAGSGIGTWLDTVPTNMTVVVGSIAGASGSWALVDSSYGNDLVWIGGTTAVNAKIMTHGGNDTVIMPADYTYNNCGDCYSSLGPGNDTAFLKYYISPHDFDGGWGDDAIYMGAMLVGNVLGNDGNDVLSCTDVQGSGGCTAAGDWLYLRGDDGNDIVSVDGTFTAANYGDATVAGGTDGQSAVTQDNNVVYIKAINGTTYNVWVEAQTSTSGGSLVIIGGNRVKARIYSNGGTQNVLLLKQGTTSTNTQVCGAAFNDTQTSCSEFARILWY